MKNPGDILILFPGYLDGTLEPTDMTRLFHYFNETDENALRKLIQVEMEAVESPEENLDTYCDSRLEAVYERIGGQIGIETPAEIIPRGLSWPLLMRYAASLLLIGGVSWFLVNVFDLFNNEGQWKKISTEYERKKIVLVDGTKVWLGPQTSLEYPEKFGADSRSVLLNGEAFFEVARDEEHPFIVRSAGLATRVLGTSFHVDAYEEDTLAKVTVLTGLVSVAAAGSSGDVKLSPFQQATFQAGSHQLSKHNYPGANEMRRRREGNIHYEGAGLTDIIKDVQRISKEEIIIGSDLSKCVFYGELKAEDSPIAFLENVCRVNNLSVSRQDRSKIKITGKGCQ